MIAFALASGFVGFCAIGVSMERHQEDVFSTPLRNWQCRLLQAVGAALLVISVTACTLMFTVSVGVSLGVALLTLPALLCVFLFACAPRVAVPSAVLVLVSAIAWAIW